MASDVTMGQRKLSCLVCQHSSHRPACQVLLLLFQTQLFELRCYKVTLDLSSAQVVIHGGWSPFVDTKTTA